MNLLICGIFFLIFLDRCWLSVTEPVESEPLDKQASAGSGSLKQGRSLALANEGFPNHETKSVVTAAHALCDNLKETLRHGSQLPLPQGDKVRIMREARDTVPCPQLQQCWVFQTWEPG